MLLRQTILCIASMAALSACVVNDKGHYTTTPPKTKTDASAVEAVEATPPSSVELIAERPDRAFTELGPVKVSVNKLTAFHRNPSVADVQIALQEKAAALGADAVIDVDITEVRPSIVSWGTRTGSGIAIKFGK